MKEEMVKKCCVCGKEFVTRNYRKKYCSDYCKVITYKKMKYVKNNRVIGVNDASKDYKRIDPHPISILKRAVTKPAGCSDVRWRIELRRRAQARAEQIKWN